MTEYVGEFKDDRIVLVEVVRCRDCKYEQHGYCSRPDEWFDDVWFAIEPDGFCAWGERRDA